MPKDPNELGALWIKSGNRGEYMTGTINGVAVVCFKNDRKTGNQPDWRVLKSQPKGTRSNDDNDEALQKFRDAAQGFSSDDVGF